MAVQDTYNLGKYDNTHSEDTNTAHSTRVQRGIFGNYYECTGCGNEGHTKKMLNVVCTCESTEDQ